MSEFPESEQVLFVVNTPIGFQVQSTVRYWDLITTVKHPIMKGRLEDVKQTLTNPDVIHLIDILAYLKEGDSQFQLC